MGGKIIVIGILALLLVSAGCVKPVQKLGCCLKPNATGMDPGQGGCVFYNMSAPDEEPVDLRSVTNGPCNDPAVNTAGACNVTLNGADRLIPICTQSELKACLAKNCTAMICGDFKYNPRPAPGFTSVDESEGDTPVEKEKQPAEQFYHAQCRFLPMDTKLGRIMSVTKSQVNVFRIGAGGSFDEFDAYRFYFPMSDKFCNANPTSKSTDIRVDRYMNYVTGEKKTYSPVTGITDNCIDDVNGIMNQKSTPFGFEEDSAAKQFSYPLSPVQQYKTILPQRSGYKYSTQVRARVTVAYDKNSGGYTYGDPVTFAYFKKFDDAFYRRQLSITYLDTIFGLGGKSGRAPFECDMSRNECYSGVCDTQTYTRSPLLKYSYALVKGEYSALQTADEVVGDCSVYKDDDGLTKVVCAPTISVQPGGGDNPPVRKYAKVDVRPMQALSKNDYWSVRCHERCWLNCQDCGDECGPDGGCGWLNSQFEVQNPPVDPSAQAGPVWDLKGYDSLKYRNYSTQRITYTPESFDWIAKGNCPNCTDCSGSWCAGKIEESTNPPVGGMVFFGKAGTENGVPSGSGRVVIGYALATPEEFANMMVVKNCMIGYGNYVTNPPPGQEGQQIIEFPNNFIPQPTDSNCLNKCNLKCSFEYDHETKCSEWCSNTNITSTTPLPCKTMNPPGKDLKKTTDYYRYDDIDLFPEYKAYTNVKTATWENLESIFQPLADARLRHMGASDASCGAMVNELDMRVASSPWVVYYQKIMDAGYENIQNNHASSTTVHALRDRNIFDEEMDQTQGTSNCELRKTSWGPDIGGAFNIQIVYNMIVAKNIYLITYLPGSGRLGNCAVDDRTYLPMVKTYGWCSPCTTSTLAYQKIVTSPNVTLPISTGKISGSETKNVEWICKSDYKGISCFNKYISDMEAYDGQPGETGSPRTVPDASIMKERLGNYMKSGILPVLDFTNASNWNKKANYNSSEAPQEFKEYDFERLIGEIGAVITIVDTVKNETDAENKAGEIADRSAIIRQKCYGCLAAFQVVNPPDNETFKNTIKAVLSDARARAGIDMVTFSYNVSSHTAALDPYGIKSAKNLSNEIVDDLASYGRVALQAADMPTMVVGFYVENNKPPIWNDANYPLLFDNIVLSQDRLVSAGVGGIIYSPVQPPAGDTSGLAQTQSDSRSVKTPKFCAFEQAIQKMTASNPIAIYMLSKTGNETFKDCVRCTSLEKASNKCGPEAKQCDDGIECTIPATATTTEGWKCQDDLSLDLISTGERCPLCAEQYTAQYTCTFTYLNGTAETKTGPVSQLNSDLYLDIIAGIPKPYKCCLGVNETRYTYVKKSIRPPLNKPFIFAKFGNPGMDCGFEDLQAAEALGSFCNTQMPLRIYDVNCTVTP